jgi:hypothetical protein
MSADPAGGEVDERHVGRGTVGDDVKGGDVDARPRSTGVATVQEIALTKWDWATLLQRVSRIYAHLAPRAPPGRNPRVPPPSRVDALLPAVSRAFLHGAPLRVLVGRVPTAPSPRCSARCAHTCVWRARRAPSRPAMGPRVIPARASRVSQPLATQRVWRPYGPCGQPPRRPHGATAGRAARAAAGRISASATSLRTAMNAAARGGGSDVVARRGDLIRGGRGRAGGGLICARRWMAYPRRSRRSIYSSQCVLVVGRSRAPGAEHLGATSASALRLTSASPSPPDARLDSRGAKPP